ncbi:hypothetical protein [Flavobacterium sangjuense]|uniref:DUF304 domain-containing protein n=1 Tax=Flavobacterium sangjuense TaxID=2518177 RepID=A0A4P7PS75_9FLAO|nr:hypothetical protein [Flavobacterium sangjuense]QBZ97070.1 hypothetical protein GS03_00555 [Flavobacterium sangjuense]
MKKNLTNGWSTLYYCVDIIFFIFSIGLFIYSLYVGEKKLILFCLLYLFWNYWFFFRKRNKFKEITFDEENIYFDQKVISYTDIVRIKFGKIEFTDSAEEKFILFMTIPVFNNLDDLIENHEKAVTL